MKNIQMVDLKGQYNKIKDQIDTAVIQTIESTSFINGPIVKEFAKSLEKYLPEIVSGNDRTYWKECEMPIYEKLYLELKQQEQ